MSEELFFDVTVQGAKANGYWRKVIVKGNHDRNDDKSDAAKRSEFFFLQNGNFRTIMRKRENNKPREVRHNTSSNRSRR